MGQVIYYENIWRRYLIDDIRLSDLALAKLMEWDNVAMEEGYNEF